MVAKGPGLLGCLFFMKGERRYIWLTYAFWVCIEGYFE